ncbi:MAG: type III pantothenate kinase [Armatimonadetes bacterium]|nr:type III pantothenate kinase [Armatimonadota bacterium]
MAVDIGNSSTSFALCSGDRIRRQWRRPSQRPATAADLQSDLAQGGHKAGSRPLPVVVSSVASTSVTEGWLATLTDAAGSTPVEVGSGASGGLVVAVREPGKLGPDRIANAVAAERFYGAPVIVVDLGTCTTVTVVDAARRIVGGSIAPGVGLSLRTLTEKTGKLPRVRPELPACAIGTDTEQAILSGVVFGTAGLVRGLLGRIRAELGVEAPAVAAGGYAKLISPLVPEMQETRADLTLQGLRIIWERSQRPGGPQRRP